MKKQKRITFGYTRNDMKEVVIYEEQAEVVKLIFELYAFNQSLAKISKFLEMYNIPSPTRACSHKNGIKNHSQHNDSKKNNIKFIITSEDFAKAF